MWYRMSNLVFSGSASSLESDAERAVQLVERVGDHLEGLRQARHIVVEQRVAPPLVRRGRR
eukprot:1935328-Lingulodinium_polyedra.AAC.1